MTCRPFLARVRARFTRAQQRGADAYIEVIKRDGGHIGALGNLGTLLSNAGYRSAARLTYNEALKHHPRDLRTLINLANALLENDELALSFADPTREDGYSVRGLTIQGVRSYDSNTEQWTTPDAYKGDVHDPMSQWDGSRHAASDFCGVELVS